MLSLIQSDHRARKGRNALLKWAPVQEAVDTGEPIYEVGAEGYPTLPVTLLLMRPFHMAGPRLGPLLWAAFKLGLAWWMLLSALGLAFGSARSAPPWALWVVLLGSFRVLHSDVQHGNLNLVVAAVVMFGVLQLARGRDALAGTAWGLGATLKVTPALGLVWLLARGSWKGVMGLFAGIVAGTLAPGLWLGFGRSWEMAQAWGRQMLVPYLSGRELSLLQTEHINQSMLGVLARHLTDAVAIPARTRGPIDPLRIGWLDLAPDTFQLVHLAASLAVLGLFSWSAWKNRMPIGGDTGLKQSTVLGLGALMGLAMVMLSERSWKHHHVLLPLALTYLAQSATNRRTRPLALGMLAAAAVAFAGSGEAILGAWGSDLAEAFGAYALGDLVLFLGIARLVTLADLSPDG